MLHKFHSATARITSAVWPVFYYPATWAAAHHLPRISFHSGGWMLSLCKAFIMAEDSPFLTAACNNVLINIALVFLLVSVCCDCWTKCDSFKAPWTSSTSVSSQVVCGTTHQDFSSLTNYILGQPLAFKLKGEGRTSLQPKLRFKPQTTWPMSWLISQGRNAKPPPSLVEDYVDVLSVSGHFQPSTSDQFPVSVSLSQKAETLTPICHGQARLPFSWHRVIHEQDAQAKGFKNSLAFGFLHNCLQTTWIVYMCVCVSKVFFWGGATYKIWYKTTWDLS